MNFRKRRFNDPNPVHFSPTELCKCPLALLDKKKGIYKEYDAETLAIFDAGSTIHYLKEMLSKGSRQIIDTELHMTVISKDDDYIISGYLDVLEMDTDGLYIVDMKSCNPKAFYYFLKDGASPSELLQVSLYAWLFYVVNKVKITKGVIRKISRDNMRNSVSLEFDLITPDEIETFVLGHPTINYFLKKINKKEFEARTLEFMKQNEWMAKYCDKKKTCSVRKQLLKDKREAKKE